MFLKRLSAALVGIVCIGSMAVGAENFTQTDATNSGKENPLVAPLDLSFIPTPISPKCIGENNGKIEVQVIAGTGTAPYRYQLQKDGGAIQAAVTNQPASFFINNLGEGTYRIYLTDALGATTINEAIIVDYPSLSLSLESSVISPLCAGGTASILFQASGGSGSGYSYILYKNGALDGTNGNGDFIGKGEGSYAATVTDGAGCTKNYVGTVNVIVPDPINFNFTVLSEINCDNGYASVQFYDLPDDEFNIDVRSNTKTYTSHTDDYIYNNLEAGSYTITVTRVSCPTDIQTKNFIIEPFAPIVVSTTPNSPVVLSCGGTNDLTDVSVTISGGKAGRQIRIVMDNNNGISDDQEGTVNYGSPVAFTDLLAGSYTIRWNDVINNNCSGTQSYVISNPSSPLLWVNDPVGIPTKCNGEASGEIQINVSGGELPYTYLVDGVAATLPINRTAGTYNVAAQDGNGCVTEERPVTITQPDPVVVSHNPADDRDLTCPRGSNGEIHMSATGGDGNYRYDLMYASTGHIYRPNVPADSNIVIGALSGGLYNVQVKDGNNCLASIVSDIEITEPDPITLSQFDLDTILCNGETVQLVVQAIGGNSSTMTYRLFLGATLVEEFTNSGVVTFDNLIPSAYTLRVWSDLACSWNFLSKSFTVVDRKKLVIDNVSDSIMISCPGDVPSFTLTVQGEAPYTYSIDGSAEVPFTGNSVVISSGLTASTTGYLNHIVVKDKYLCENDINVTIYEPLPIINTEPVVTDARCKSKNNGIISLDVSGGRPGYTLAIIDASTSQLIKTKPSSTGVGIVISNMPAGIYNINITDRNRCPAPNPITNIVVDEPDSLAIEVPVYDPILCYGNETDVNLTANGGWAVDKTINITGQGVNQTIASGSSYTLKAGTYTLTATNTDGCKATRIMTIDQPDQLVLTVDDVDNVSCFEENDAKIEFSVVGGIPDYQYGLGGAGSAGTMFTGNTGIINTGLIEGSYELIVRDANLCESNIVPITITEPEKVVFEVKVDSVSCFGLTDGKVTIQNATGGNDNNYKAFIGGTRTTFPVISNLAAGTYEIMITDSKGCESETQIVVVNQPEVIVLDEAFVSDSLLCYNDQNAAITVEASGGLPYSLRYKITGRDYQLSNEFPNLAAGEYEVWVRNNMNKCEAKFPAKLYIENPTEITVTNLVIDDVSCHNLQDGEVKINANGGTGALSYFLTDAPASVDDNPNATGRFRTLGEVNKSYTTYNYRIEDKNQCNKTGSFTIKNPDELIITELEHHQVYCNGEGNGWIKVEVKGGNGSYIFQKNVGEPATSDVEAITSTYYLISKYTGTSSYQPVVIDSKNCADTIAVPIEIVDPPRLIIEDVIAGEKLCFNSTNDTTQIILDPVEFGTPGYTYSIDGGNTFQKSNQFFNVRTKIVYPVVKDTMQCTASYEAQEIVWPDAFNVSLTKNEILCWDNQRGTVTVDIDGGTAPFYVSVNDIMFSNPVTIDFDSLHPTTIDTIKGDNFFLYGVANDVYIKDDNDCPALNFGFEDATTPVANFTWASVDTFTLISITPSRPKCAGANGSITYDVKGGKQPYYYWIQSELSSGSIIPTNSDDDGLINVPTGILLYAFVRDKNKCWPRVINPDDPSDPAYPEKYLTTTITPVRDTVQVEIDTLKQPYCPLTRDGKIGLQVNKYLSGGVTFTVSRLDTIYNNYYEVYSKVITREEATDSFEVEFFDPNFPEIPAVQEMMYAVNKYEVEYKFRIGKYLIDFVDNNTECGVSYNFELVADTLECPDVYPLIFTPNRDGQNDTWVVSKYEKADVDLKIFSQYGELVYQFSGQVPEEGLIWDGLDLKGRPVPVGTYMYVYQPDVSKDKTDMEYGTVTLLRNN